MSQQASYPVCRWVRQQPDAFNAPDGHPV